MYKKWPIKVRSSVFVSLILIPGILTTLPASIHGHGVGPKGGGQIGSLRGGYFLGAKGGGNPPLPPGNFQHPKYPKISLFVPKNTHKMA